MSTKIFQGLITNEGIDKARDVQSTEGWFISPYEFAISESRGEFVNTRTINNMQTAWVTGKFSAIEKKDNNKLLVTITLAGDESAVQKNIKEIYIKCKTTDGTQFLYALIQPLIDMTFTPTVVQQMSFLITLTNTTKEDIYTVQYVDTTKLNSYQLITEKGKQNGYCPLGADGIVPDNYLPVRSNLPIGSYLSLFCTKDYKPKGYALCDGTELSYEDYHSVYEDYLLAGLLPTCTYIEFENSIRDYGSCAKFGLDTENLKFRVPLISDGTMVQQAMTDNELNKLYNPAIPNIKGDIGNIGKSGGVVATGPFSYSYNHGDVDFHGVVGAVINFDASRVSTIYKNDCKTVQPKAVALRSFVLLSHGSVV